MSIKRRIYGQWGMLALFVAEATIPESYLIGWLDGVLLLRWLDFQPVNLFEPENDVE